MPKHIIVAIKEDPPADTKGRVTPVIGRSPMFIPIWTIDWTNKTKNKPDMKALADLSLVLLMKEANLKSKSNNPIIRITDPKKPSSSDIEAKIKSVCLSGKNANCVWTPLPNPLPNNLPDPTAIIDCMELYPPPKGSDLGFKKVTTLSFWYGAKTPQTIGIIAITDTKPIMRYFLSKLLANIIPRKPIVVSMATPKDGWIKIKINGKRNKSNDLIKILIFNSFPARKFEKNMNKKGLTISEGWIVEGPRLIHLIVPRVIWPISTRRINRIMLPI